MDVSRGTWKLQLPGKYDSASQDIDACDHSLEVWKSKLNGIFFRFVPHWRGWSYQQLNKEAYSVAGEMGFGWWLVEHYLPYHVNRPNGCDSGEPTRGR